MSRIEWWHARSLLFVPGDRPDLAAKAAAGVADAPILDLEDAVTPANKVSARASLAHAVPLAHAGKPALVRINNARLDLSDDLKAARSAGADGLMVPKARGAGLLAALQEAILQLERPAMPMLALVEHPAVFAHPADLLAMAQAPGVKALALGSEDLAAGLRCVPGPTTLLLPCQMLVMATRAAGRRAFAVPASIAALVDPQGWQRSARTARELGADGGLCIHPRQAEALNAAFDPTDPEVRWARRVTAAHAEAVQTGRGAATVDGAMVDAPVAERARSILSLLTARGHDATSAPKEATPMTSLTRRSICFALASAAWLTASATRAADDYPTRPITLVVPFAPGGTTDILGRIVGEGMSKRLGQPVVIDNRGGAGGNIGAAAVAKSEPDGYTLLLGYNGTNAINPSLYKSLAWDPIQSFDPISMVARVNNVVVVNPALEVRSLPELVAYARANPGKLNYGSAGPGSIFHLAGAMFSSMTGIEMVHVPYKGAAPALTDLMGGRIEVMFSTIPTALSFIEADKLRAIAVTGEQRSPLFPDLPTAREAGYPDMVLDSWFAVFAPAGTPAEVEARLTAVVKEVIADREVRAKMEQQGADPQASDPAELARILKNDLARWKVVVDEAQVSIE